MAQELKSINLVAPGFKGINTEDSPLSQDPSFAESADNAVIDNRGRLAARKGYVLLTQATFEYVVVDDTTGFQPNETITGGTSGATATITEVYNGTVLLIEDTRSGTFSASETLTGGTSGTTATFSSTQTSADLSTNPLRAIKEFKDDAGNIKVFSVGNNKILSGTETLVDETPSGYTISDDNWKMVTFNDKIYFFQSGHEPLVYDSTSKAVEELSSVSGAAGVALTMYGNEVLAAYGRLWTADFATEKSKIYWSDLLIGQDWSGGTAGSIDISKVWPDGYDEIVALAAHNNALIIFGKHSIVVYSGAEAPASMQLSDTVAGIGCIGRDTVQYTGSDVLFLSQTGLKSFGRTIQEKSMPLTTLSSTITKDIIQLINEANELYKSVYHPEENFYLLTFSNQDTTYCFDIRGTLENGSYRVTRWPGTGFKCYESRDNGNLLIGNTSGFGRYAGYQDNGSSYRLKYFSPELTFGDPSKIKFLKKLRPTLIGGSGARIFLKWSYDFGTAYNSASITIRSQGKGEYGLDEYPEFSELSSYGISSTLTGGVYVVNKFLGDFTSAPTTGSGGGALLNGDSYFDTATDTYYVYISGSFVDLSTLSAVSFAEFSEGELTSREAINTNSSGSTLTIGLESDINGQELSLQDINVLALVGKTI